MAKTKRSKTKRNFRSMRPPVLFTFVQNILTEMAANPADFPNPKVALALLLTALNKAIASYNKHLSNKGLGTTTFETDYENLIQMLFDQADYVDDIADGDLATILLSGFKAVGGGGGGQHKKDESYTQGVSGTVHAVIRKRAGATGYLWQYCIYDPSGEPVWIIAECTRYAKHSYIGLIPGTTYLFRYCPTINNKLDVFSVPYKMIVT